MKSVIRIVGKGLSLGLLFLILTVSFTSAALVDNGDGTVSDTETGLMWQQAEAGSMNWQNALDYCEDLVLPTGGYDDWRLPDRNELQSLVDYSYYNPAIYGHNINGAGKYFPGVLSSYYWSSTTYANYTYYAWHVNFYSGNVYVHNKTYSYYVRAVRSGQSGPLEDSAILTISPSSRTVAAGAGSTTFDVSNSGEGDMNWTAMTGDDWLEIASGSSGTNAGMILVGYAVNNETTNPGGSSRTGTITVSAPGAENSPQILVVTQSRETSLDGVLHHFEFSAVSSPQQINDSFSITVIAKDVYGNTVSSFNERVSLFSSLGRVNPTALDFSLGTVTANVVLYNVGNSYLRCDGGGAQGQSNNFDVNGVSQCLSDVTGSLVDEKGDPVVGAKVLALLNPYGSPTQEVVTDAQGKYIFEDLACGKYWLRVLTNEVATGDPVTQAIKYITADGGRLSFPPSIIKINAHTYGTPVILVAGMMASASSFKIVKILGRDVGHIPVLAQAKPDPNVYILDKSKYGWESLENDLKDDFLIIDCPWDWRLGADEAMRGYLIPVIIKALQRSTTGKVHIVAHSMGGLLARALIQSDIVYDAGEKYYEKIDKLVMVATPHLGSCNPYYIWEGGDPKGLDDLVGNGIENPYDRVFQELWEKTYIKKKWSSKAHCAIVDFLVDDVYEGYDKSSSLRQLMYTGDFLTLKSDSGNPAKWWDVTTAGNENIWLKSLNASSNVNRMTANMVDSGKVRTLVLAGNGKETLHAIHVWKVCSLCPEGKYLDGLPVGPVKDEDNANLVADGGDGTVPYVSAIWLAAQGWAAEGLSNGDAEHSKLPGKFNSQISTFLTGVENTATLVRATETPTSTLTFTIDNSQRFIVSDPSGNQTGIDSDTGDVVDEIAGAYMSFDGRQGVISLPEPVVGSYLMTYFGGPEREFDLAVAYENGEEASVLEKSGFSPDSPVTVEVLFDSLSDPAISLNPPIVGCDCLSSQPYEDSGQLYTRLQWDDNADAVAYRVYTVADTEPYYHELAEISKTANPEYDTGELWRDSEAEPLRVYVVTYLDSDGNESFFSNKVYNDDRDHDGLTDLEEVVQGTDVDNPDTDGDGLSDGDEVSLGSFPDDPDSDDDGYDDYGEVQGHSDPRFAESIPDLHVNDDGVCNGEYYCYPTIAEACQASAGVGRIKVGQGDYPETLELDENKLITMTGGWNSDYTMPDSDSVVVGSLTISSGCLTVEKLILGEQ